MLKLGSNRKGIGTMVVCQACRHPNPGIYIWCERCGAPLDWHRPSNPPAPSPVVPAAKPKPVAAPVARTRRALTLPRLTLPAVTWPRLSMPRLTLPRPSLPRIPRIVLVVAAILAVLLIVPLAYMLLPAGRAAVNPQIAANHLSLTSGPTAAGTAQAAAIPGVEAKTHLPYRSDKCATNQPCLTVTSETVGKDAAAVVFSTAASAARECVGYVYRSGGAWHFLDAVCGLPDQLSPMVAHDAVVHVPGNCANVRDGASLTAAVVACLKDGSTVHIDGGPTYADSRLWWHEQHGWVAHDFLTGP
jgi:hypothetical protein